jgi:hypothetical protein
MITEVQYFLFAFSIHFLCADARRSGRNRRNDRDYKWENELPVDRSLYQREMPSFPTDKAIYANG